MNHDTTMAGWCMDFSFEGVSSINSSSSQSINQSTIDRLIVCSPNESESWFYQYFSRCPVPLQLTNVIIKDITQSTEHAFVKREDCLDWLSINQSINQGACEWIDFWSIG